MSTNKSLNNKKHSSKSAVYNNKNSKLFLLPLVAIVAILPFIMRLHVFNSHLSSNVWFSNEDSKFDIFLYYKQEFFIFCCIVMLLIILYKIFIQKMKLHMTTTIIPILVYGLLAFLSTIFSKYSAFGFTGIYEQFESVFVILGYCLVIYYAFLFIKSEDDIRFIFKYLLISILILCVLGLTQILGHDILATDFGKKLYISKAFWDQLNDFTFTFGKSRVYLTLYNPNYVGVYVSLIIPFLIGLFISAENKKSRILYALAILGLIICLIGSASKTSLLCIFISLLFTAVFFRKYLFQKNKYTIPVFAAGLILVIIFAFANLNLIKNTIYGITNIHKLNAPLTNIETDNDAVTFTYNGNRFHVSLEQANEQATIVIKDDSGNLIATTVDSESGYSVITDERFSGIQIAPANYNDMLCLAITINGKQWAFTDQTGDNTYYLINMQGKYDKIKTADSAIFTGYETFASGRGYIWSRTIPLLKKYIILGSGADSFSFVFPHEDYVNSYNAGFDGQLVSRPHSLYLQIAVQTGVLSLIAFLLFYALYFISSFKIYIKGNFPNFYYNAGASIFLGTIAYMIAGITNDSTINVAPVFWVLIGIGVAINLKIKTENKSIQEKI